MSTSAVAWNKGSLLEHKLESPIQKQKLTYWFRLASESSSVSTDDTESVYSVQDRETDFVKDTTDTESDTSEYDVDLVEYEIETVCGDDRDMILLDSSDDDSDNEDILFAAAAVAGDSSLENFVTDGEESDNSGEDDSSAGLTDFWICMQCKSQNDNPQYRFCDKCFQDRKAIFPPRPRRLKKPKRKVKEPVQLSTLKNCLKSLSSQKSGVSSQDSGVSSQDSGIGSSQEFPPLHFEIEVMLDDKPSSSSSEETKSRKRQHSESSLSDFEAKRPKKQPKLSDKKQECDDQKSKESDVPAISVITEETNPKRTKAQEVKGGLSELNEDCMMCNAKPKNSVFLHGRIAHMCCCYGCAMRVWRSLKRCPICKRKVSNVVRVFTT